MTLAFPAPAWLVGCGNMAGAMIEGWRSAGVDLTSATVIRPSGRPVEGVRTRQDYPGGDAPRLVVLGFKPQKLDEVAPLLTPLVGADTAIVSMLAGVEVASLRARLPNVGSIVRILPNLPVAIGMGVIPLFGDGDAVHEIVELMRPLGMAIATRDEAELAAIGAIAGAGPAYVARFAEALAKAGRTHGVAGGSLEIALQTLVGTASLMQATGEDGAALTKRVASPGGTTEAGLNVLDRAGALDRLLGETIDAAIRRGRELAAAASIDRADPLA